MAEAPKKAPEKQVQLPEQSKIKETLDKIPLPELTGTIKQEGADAREDLKLEMFLSKLDKKDTEKIKNILKLGDLTSESLKGISTMDLVRAEGKENGTLMVLFGEKLEKEGAAKRAFGYKEFEGGKFNKSVQVGDKISVDFKGNMDAFWNIGAGDMLPETVRKVRIIDDKKNERVSDMRQGLRGGFFDSKGYMPVFDGYTIVVEEAWSDTELAEYKKNLAKKEKEEQAYLERIYRENPSASRGKMQSLKDVFDEPDLSKLDETMDKAMADLGVDASFKPVLYSFIKHESSFKINKGPETSTAWGLFQLLKGKKDEKNYRWIYNELGGRMREFTGNDFSYEEFRDTMVGQVYAGILYFKERDLKPVEAALGRLPNPNNPRDNYLLYIAHHEGAGVKDGKVIGGLEYYLRTGKFKSGVNIGGYAWKVANGAEFYKQELVKMEVAKSNRNKQPKTTETARESSKEMPQTHLPETAFMGDSLTKGMELYGGINGAGTFGIGGQNTGQMLKRFELVVGKYKKVVILAGVNNIGSDWTVAKITRDLEKMYKMARSTGIKVVACTLPPWGKFIENHSHKKFAVERGLTVEKLQVRTEKLNNWIRSQEGGLVDKVVDLYKFMGNTKTPEIQSKEYAAGDGLHQTARGSRLMAEIIKREGGIA